MQAMPSAWASAGLRSSTGSPSTAMSPASGRYRPVMILISVDLPAPFSPTRAWISPGRRSSETPRSAWVEPKLFETSRTCERQFGLADALP